MDWCRRGDHSTDSHTPRIIRVGSRSECPRIRAESRDTPGLDVLIRFPPLAIMPRWIFFFK